MAGVDGLGEPMRTDAPVPPPEPRSAAEPGSDAVAALDDARDRLRRRAEELRREIVDGDA